LVARQHILCLAKFHQNDFGNVFDDAGIHDHTLHHTKQFRLFLIKKTIKKPKYEEETKENANTVIYIYIFIYL